MKFYFTYGSGGQPYVGGWTEIEAENRKVAAAVFLAYHPDTTEGLLNCSSVYDEEAFKKTSMHIEGNFGFFCHETISVVRTVEQKEATL